ncbi:MAG: GT4 family glycosyltransferase PelF [Candidatus Eremiobacterota bacterium]
MLDVVYFCEGTYPYVPGGVSSWIHLLIQGNPDLKFGLVYLAPSASTERRLRYELPENVHEIVEFDLYDVVTRFPQVTYGNKEKAWHEASPFLHGLINGHGRHFRQAFPYLCGTATAPPVLSFRELAFSHESWRLLTQMYEDFGPRVPFNDFFWTWRYAYFPLFKMFNAEVPRARVYHAVTTGWSGFLGVIAAMRHKRPLILTEHGLYVNERRIEITQADWIYVDKAQSANLEAGLGTFKQIWINLFVGLGKACYENANFIYTLHRENKEMQVSFGADGSKIQIIPNGVDYEALSNPGEPALPRDESKYRVGFIGRIVPIKDVKTLIKSVKLLEDKIPGLEVYLCGPTDEDPSYYAECKTMVEALDLGHIVRFMGRVDVRKYYQCFDVQVLTSISEGQPLVILEGFCSRLPCVAPDVGSCAELLLGGDPEDTALGPAGVLTWVGNPQQTAEALLALYKNPELRRQYGENGRKRAERYYTLDKLLARYRTVYDECRMAHDRTAVGML